MEYCTVYNLSISNVKPEEFNQMEEYLQSDECWLNDYEYDESYDGGLVSGSTDYVTWYDHDEDLCAMSKEYPDSLFELYGNGADEEDIWVTYYKNGKMQQCPARIEIEYDDFDESKLKEPEQ